MFAVDDELESSAKHEALDELPPDRRSRAWEAWIRLGAACRKRGNGGAVTPALLAKILHTWKPAERARAALDLVEARGGRAHGLWIAEGDGFRFHAWEEWQPDEEEAAAEREAVSAGALRSRRWRHRKRLGLAEEETPADTPEASPVTSRATSRATPEASPETVTSNVTPSVTRDACETPRARSAPATRVRVPDPSRSPPDQNQNSSRGASPDQVAREPAPPGPRDALARAWRVGFIRRFEKSGAGLTHGGPQGSDLIDLIDAAERQPDPLAFVERALDGFFATPRLAKIRPPFPPKILAEDPVGWAACATSPSGASDAHNAELVAGIPRLEVP